MDHLPGVADLLQVATGVVTAAQSEGAAGRCASSLPAVGDGAKTPVGLAVDATTSSGATYVNDGASQIPRGGLRRCIGAG
jgi:hypothetical protein